MSDTEQLAAFETLSSETGKTLAMAEDSEAARVSLTPVTLAATQTLMADGLRDARLATVASQIAGAVDEIVLGRVSVFDANGAHLNLKAIQDYEQKAFWIRAYHHTSPRCSAFSLPS